MGRRKDKVVMWPHDPCVELVAVRFAVKVATFDCHGSWSSGVLSNSQKNNQ